MTQRFKFVDPNLKSYLTKNPKRERKKGIFHPQHRAELMGACKAIACIAGFMLFILVCFSLGNIAEIIANG